MRALRALIALSLLLHATVTLAQSSGSVHGVVTTNTNQPAAGVDVQLVDLHRSTTTDAQGNYRFTNVPPGRHLLLADSARFGTATTEINVNGDTAADVTLDVASVHHEEIVVSATGDPRASSELAQIIEKVEGQELQARQQPTLGETLAQQPGVTSTGFVPGASRPVIRGFGGDRIRVLEDGVGTGDASNVSQDHNVSIDPVNAESIEIVRGPSTLLYGSNAVGGVVNVIDDRIPMESPGAAFSGVLDLRGSSNASERNAHLALTGGQGFFAWQASANKRRTGDYDTPIGTLFNSDIDAQSASLGGSFVGSRGFAGLSYSSYDSNYGISEAGPGVEPDEVVRIDMQQRRLDAKGELQLTGPISRLRFRLGSTDYEHSEVVNGDAEATFLNDATEVRLEANHRDFGPLRGAFGVQFSSRDFRMQGEESLLPPTGTTNRALFFFEEAVRGPWRFQFGGRYEHQEVDVEADDLPDRSFNGLSGSAGVVFVPNDDYTIALSLSRSSRLPVAEELYFNGPHEATFQFQIGDPNLRKENGNGIDVAFRKRSGIVTGEVSLFAQHFDGYIFENPTGETEDDLPVFVFSQADATFRGAEGHADIELLHRDPNHLVLELTADYVHASLSGGGSLPFIPPLRYGAGLRFQGQSLYLLGEVRHANAQNDVADFEAPTDGYTLVNAAVGYRFFLANTVHDVLLRGNNLTDKLAYNHVNPLKDVVPLPGRDFTLSYRLTF